MASKTNKKETWASFYCIYPGTMSGDHLRCVIYQTKSSLTTSYLAIEKPSPPMTPTRDAPTGESSSARYVEESPMTRGFWHLWMVEGSIPSQWHLLLLFFVLIYPSGYCVVSCQRSGKIHRRLHVPLCRSGVVWLRHWPCHRHRS